MANNNHKRLLPFWIYIVVIIILSCIVLNLTFSYFGVNYSCVGNSNSTRKHSTVLTTSNTDEDKEVNNPLYPLSTCPFNIIETYTYIDSAGGVDLILYYENNATNEIKYVYLYVTPYNRVGDIEASEIGKKTTAKCRLIGPYNKGDCNNVTFENVWYNHSISTVKIEKIEIEYMNGRTHVYR